MNLIYSLIDFVLHIDKHLNDIIQSYGLWTYLILFLIIFAETGLVVTPFLPGDSLIFAIGALSSGGRLDIKVFFLILCAAAVLGDTANYHIGHYIGPKVFEKERIKFLKKEHLIKTQKFYEKYGGKTIIFARFIPIIRTFAPFVAGIGTMSYRRFITYNFIGGILWVSLFLFGGYIFGNIPIVKHNFTLVIFAIIIISIVPAVIEVLKEKRKK